MIWRKGKCSRCDGRGFVTYEDGWDDGYGYPLQIQVGCPVCQSWRRAQPERTLWGVPYVRVLLGRYGMGTFYGITTNHAWRRAGRWIAKQERGNSEATRG